MMLNKYNPDVLSCLANLSNDEVFTPPEVVNRMLDMLPQELFESSETTFLDPCCKSGVFLREIAKRLLKNQMPGYEDAIEEINRKKSEDERLSPEDKHFENELQKTVDHIFHKQLFGIAITEMTSLLSRRSVYCTKHPDSEYSISKFDRGDGNIRFKKIQHTWVDGKCKFCGANMDQYSRAEELESHAYEWIHTVNPEGIFDMKFDVIIGNPPYQLSDGGNGASASPLYQFFVEQSKKLKPRYLSMIIPARWYAGGKGLDDFRESMLKDKRVVRLVDYVNAKDCFAGTSIGGGVCYFLWSRDSHDVCEYTNIHDGQASTFNRDLSEFPVFVRYNEAVSIIHRVQKFGEESITSLVGTRNPYGFSSSERGSEKKLELKLISSGGEGFVSRNQVSQGKQSIDKYKVMISKVTSEHAGEPDKNGMFTVISTTKILKPKEICTDSYLVVYESDSLKCATNFAKYLCTKFFRFLLLQAVSSINLSKEKFQFIPMQNFEEEWNDEKLYAKYKLRKEEIQFLEGMIKEKFLDKEDA